MAPLLRTVRVTSILALLVGVESACRRSPPPVEEVPHGAALTLDSATFRLERVGDSAMIVPRLAGAVAPSAGMRWRSTDTAIIQVGDSNGVVVAVGDGVARVWIRLADDSVSAIVVVEEPLPSFELDPRTMTFDAVGAFRTLRIARGAEFFTDGLGSYCESSNRDVVAVSQNAAESSDLIRIDDVFIVWISIEIIRSLTRFVLAI